MVKPPRIRHSKPKREPVTIDLDPGEVKRSPSTEEATNGTAEAETSMAADAPAGGEASSKPVETASDVPTGSEAKTPVRSESASTGSSERVEKDEPVSVKSGSETPEPKAAAPSGSAFGRDATTPPQPAGSAKPASAPRTPSPAPTESPRKRSGVSLVAAGLIGGVVAIAGAGALQLAGVLPSPGGERVDISGLEQEVADLRAQIAAPPEDDGSAEAVAAATARIGELESALGTLRTDIEAVRESVASGGGGDEAVLQSFQTRVSELEQAVTALREASADAGETEALAGRIDGVESIARTASEAAAAAASAASAASEKITALETRLAGIDERVEQQAQNPRIALAIAAAGLKSAIDRGAPFMTELETYAAIAPDAPEIAALRELAAAGVPTRAQIAARAPDAVTRMIDAAEPVDPDAGLFARFVSSFQSVVKVRPVGEVEGEGVGPTAARIEAAVEANDYARALSEYETLPDIAKAAGADFIADLRARQTADELVDRALSGALRA